MCLCLLYVCKKNVCVYIYIYYFFKKKQKPVKLGQWIYFHPVMGFNINQKHQKKINRTSSDLMDKIIQNRHRKEGWEGVEEG